MTFQVDGTYTITDIKAGNGPDVTAILADDDGSGTTCAVDGPAEDMHDFAAPGQSYAVTMTAGGPYVATSVWDGSVALSDAANGMGVAFSGPDVLAGEFSQGADYGVTFARNN